MHNLSVVNGRIAKDPVLKILRVATLHLLEADVASIPGHAGRSFDEFILWPLLRLRLSLAVSRRCCCGRRVVLRVPDPLHLIGIPVSVMASICVRISNALICAKVPVEVSALLFPTLFGSEEATTTGSTLVRLSVVERMNQFGSEDLERSS